MNLNELDFVGLKRSLFTRGFLIVLCSAFSWRQWSRFLWCLGGWFMKQRQRSFDKCPLNMLNIQYSKHMEIARFLAATSIAPGMQEPESLAAKSSSAWTDWTWTDFRLSPSMHHFAIPAGPSPTAE